MGTALDEVFVEALEPEPDELLDVNPGLVYGRATGWGQSGPRATQAGHDMDRLDDKRAGPDQLH